MGKIISAVAVLAFVATTGAFAAAPHQQSTQTYVSSSMTGSAAGNPNVPGATGSVIVRGDHSTIAGDALATQMQRNGRI